MNEMLDKRRVYLAVVNKSGFINQVGTTDANLYTLTPAGEQ